MSARLAPPPPRPPRWRLALFAAGDFAFNLYWQSAMLYLLFYYTEALGLPVRTAAACYAIASVWDGAVNLFAGLAADRLAPRRGHAAALVWGAVPLGLAFVFAYVPPALAGFAGTSWGALGWVLGGQLLFRTLYALVNIPYLALSARISPHPRDRAAVAGGRMLAGTLAAVVVAFATQPLGRWLLGMDGPRVYAASAALFAAMASAGLIAVGLSCRHAPAANAARGPAPGAALRIAAGNAAFVQLCAAMVAMVIAVTMLDKSVLYYFKYRVGDASAGQLTLGAMMAVGGIGAPVWLAVSRRTGIVFVWHAAIAICTAGLVLFVLGALRATIALQALLVTLQGTIVGLSFALWALIPEAIAWGDRRGRARTDAAIYGTVALLQRLAIGLGTLLLGLTLDHVGLHRGGSDLAFRVAIAALPLLFLILASLAMRHSPLSRDA